MEPEYGICDWNWLEAIPYIHQNMCIDQNFAVAQWIIAGAVAFLLGIWGVVSWLRPKKPTPETVPSRLFEKEREAHDKTKSELEEQIRREQNPDQALEESKARIKELEAQLGNITPDEAPAKDAFDNGDFATAREEFEKLREDKQLDVEKAAEYEYALGIIAEEDIRWLDAATHFSKSADLAPNWDRLRKASEFLWRAGDNKTALIYSQKLIDWAIAHDGENSENHASALNNHALQLKTLGELDRAKKLFEEAIEIGKVTIGDKHPDYATRLNNLALVLEAQGELDRAKVLFEEAIEIGKATIGDQHPDYATRLNNLASVLEAQGELDRAKELYEEAIEIAKATIGDKHPNYATHLNNLAHVLEAQGELDRAKVLYEEALAILKATLPADHQNIKTTEDNLKILNDSM